MLAESHGETVSFRAKTDEVIPLAHPITLEPCRIGECELIAATMAIFYWSLMGKRNILLCTDNQNVLSCVEAAKSQAPSANRVIRALNLFCLRYQVEVLRVYVRSEHNIFADGLTRWSQSTLDDWSSQEGMNSVNALAQFWAHLFVPFNTTPLAPRVPGTFALLGEVLPFFQQYRRYRVCGWRPSNSPLAGIMEIGGSIVCRSTY